MLHSRLACALVAIALGTGCAMGTPYNPYILPKDEFATRIHTIAVAPVSALEGLSLPKPARQRIEALVLAQLENHGFATVAPAEVQAIREVLHARGGGIFDPVTGKADVAKADTVRLETLRELGTRFHADALLYPMVEVVQAKFWNGEANWCGAEQGILPQIENPVAWFFASNQANQASGSIPASCLVAVIDEISGLEIYKDFGGIEIIQTFDGTGFTTRPSEELFTDAVRLEAAVTLAVGALPGGTATAPAP